MTFVQAIEFFNVCVGLLLTFTIIVFGAGIIVYIARFGTWPSHRDAAIKVLEWGVTLLFVLVILLAIVQAFEHHTAVALSILAFIILILIAWLVIWAASESGGKKDAKKEAPKKAAPKGGAH